MKTNLETYALILRVFCHTRDVQTVAASDAFPLSYATLYRWIHYLEERGLVQQDGTTLVPSRSNPMRTKPMTLWRTTRGGKRLLRTLDDLGLLQLSSELTYIPKESTPRPHVRDGGDAPPPASSAGRSAPIAAPSMSAPTGTRRRPGGVITSASDGFAPPAWGSCLSTWRLRGSFSKRS